ncbi:MAG: TolB family protein [Terriglobales bacterium]
MAGGTPRQVWSGFVFGAGIPVSPDGTRLFAMARGSAPEAHVPTIVRLDGGQPQAQIVPGLDYTTMLTPYGWTADGRAITFIHNQGTVDNIWAMPIAGGKPFAVTHFTDLRISSYAFSSDGRLAVSRLAPNSDMVVAH